jgi:hypothetical protein
MGHIRDRFGVGSRSPPTAHSGDGSRTGHGFGHTASETPAAATADSNQSATASSPNPAVTVAGPVTVDSWWRGLPARAWTTSVRRDDRTAGRMPTAPWEASPRAVRRVRRATATATAAASGSAFCEQRRGPRRPRIPDTATGHGVGDGRECSGTLGSPAHRPAVAFGACRAFVPARRPAVARVDLLTRTVSATFGRLDGLLGGCGNLLRQAIPGGAPHGIVPIGTRTQSAQYRVLHARRCATSRVQQCPRTHLQIAWGGGSECRGGPPFPPRKSSDRGSGRVSGSVAPETAWSVTVSEIRVRWPVSAIGLQAPMLFVVAVTVTVSVPVPSAVLLPLAGLRFTGDPGDASGSSLAVTQLR